MSAALGLARWYVRRRLARGFDGVHVWGLDAARRVAADEPVIFAANHVGWWDGLLLLQTSAALGVDARFLMDATNLARMPWVRAIGAIGLAPGVAGRNGLGEAVDSLRGPRQALWIFPQGRQRPGSVRPLGLHPGVETLHRRSSAPVIPVSITYGWRETHRPTAVVGFGPPIRGGRLLDALEAALVAGLDANDAWLDARPGQIEPLVSPRERPTWDGLGSRLLTWMWR